MAKSSVGKAWRRIRKTAGLGDDIRIHDLRHSFASDAAMSGVPLAVIGKVLGHKSPRITARYAHVSNEVVADALERTSARILDAQSSRPTTRTRKPKSAKPRQGPRRRRSKS